MNICLPTTISAITASSEHATYPDDHLLLPRPRVVWQAASGAVTSATLTCTLTGPVDTVVLLGAVAATAVLEVWTGSAWAAPAGLEAADYADTYQATTGWWWHCTALTGSVQLRITLTQSGAATIRAALLVAGTQVAVPGVQYPVAEGLVDSSVITTMSDGTVHVRKRAAARTFAATLRATRDVCRSFLQTSRGIGRTATMFNLCTTVDADKWMVYGRFSSLPQGTHDLPTLSVVQFAIEEAL